MLHLDSNSVKKLLSFELGLQLSEDAFRLHSSGQVEQPLRTIVRGGENELMGVMPAYIKSGPYRGFGLKSVVVRLGAEARGPSHTGSVLIYDEAGTSPIVAVDAGAITEIRTAAASAHVQTTWSAPVRPGRQPPCPPSLRQAARENQDRCTCPNTASADRAASAAEQTTSTKKTAYPGLSGAKSRSIQTRTNWSGGNARAGSTAGPLWRRCSPVRYR